MPRACLLALVVVLCFAADAARAQHENAPRMRQTSRSQAAYDNRESFSVEQPIPGQPKTPITRTESASKKSDSNADPKAKPASPAASMWTSFGSLVVILVVILLFARTWKKHGPRINGYMPAEAVEVLGKRPLDQKSTLHLVRLGSKILLLGSSPDGLRTLSEVTNPVDVDYLAGICRQNDDDGTAAQTFRALFNRNLPPEKSKRTRTTRPPIDDQAAEELSRFQQHDLEEAHG